ncbi:ester cyclase [Lactobacillus mulieris]|uniref:ester cyclase n=1 Tax=Lactobacillus mulieris TaxID=2508708 RepID=UPI0014329686|nr:ester cyclase [Lactobacillus mulieris]MCF1784363.1 ester cyclase [Lactobacillus mulieris]MCW8105083.1 ester cyclase [Lactobacillus mulieris]MDK6803753.1 ester cyclase [Lactobacillus mulieris]MDK8382927.1 ester cyclase [Lactobacillus mulieris]MDT9621033.1 ester cyclase [Lactobacillus mulieris]
MNNLDKNKAVVEKLIVDALPNNNVDFVKTVVTPETVTHRVGFADLYEATGDAIPQDGNFMEWMRDGWDVLHAALSDQKVEMKHMVAEDNKVIAQFHYNATHSGTFAGQAGDNKKITWDEFGIFIFNEEGKITEMWYYITELSAALQLGYKLK